MTVTHTVLFPPPQRNSGIPDSLLKWFFSLQNLHPMEEIDTTAGNVVFALPAAGLSGTTGQSNQNMEVTVVKTSGDANTVTVTGASGGPVVLTTNSGAGSHARFKSNGTLWRVVT
jgi:hypothetical protein